MLRYWNVTGNRKKTWISLICVVCVVLFSASVAAENKSELTNKGNGGVDATKKVEKRRIKEYSSLKVTSVEYNNGNLDVEGTSDLPDNSIVSIKIAPVGVNDSTISLSAKAVVTGGEFRSVFKVPNNPKWYKGPYKIEVKFFLDMQTDIKVLHLLGDFAKNLTGKLVVVVPYTQYKSLQYSIIKKIRALELKAYSVVNPKAFLHGEPKYILACFFKEWKKENWKGMLKYSYIPWVKSEKTPIELLKEWFGSKKLIGAKIINCPITNSLMTELNIKIFYISNEDERMQVKNNTEAVKVIKDDNDNWGVFPLSFIKKNAIYKMDLNTTGVAVPQAK